MRSGERGVQLMPPEREAYRGTSRVLELARTYALVGRQDAAIERLTELLARPGDLTVALLRLDPAWDPLRADPRFQALLSAGP